MRTRKHTKFQTCEQHDWLNGKTRSRRAEFFAEGGPTDAPCKGGECKMWAGTDMFVPEVCEDMAEYPLYWPVNDV